MYGVNLLGKRRVILPYAHYRDVDHFSWLSVVANQVLLWSDMTEPRRAQELSAGYTVSTLLWFEIRELLHTASAS